MFKSEQKLVTTYTGLYKFKKSKSKNATFVNVFIGESKKGITNVLFENNRFVVRDYSNMPIEKRVYYEVYRIKLSKNPDRYRLNLETGKVEKPFMCEDFKIYETNVFSLYIRGVKIFTRDRLEFIIEQVNKLIEQQEMLESGDNPIEDKNY